jgi:predicted permease
VSPMIEWFGEIGRRVRILLHRKEFDREMDEELRLHRGMKERELVEAGESPEEAHFAAQRRVGNTLRLREESREAWGWNWLEHFLQDVRFGVRMLRKSPGFTVVAILTLALGIGANTAIFGVLDAVLLRPLPFKDPSGLVWATERFPFNHGSAGVISPDFAGWQEHNQVFEEIGASSGGASANLTGVGEAARVNITSVTVSFFPMLGARPIIGRLFLPQEGRLGQEQVALLSETLWRSQFGGDPHVLGRTIQLDGTDYTVVGVMPASLRPTADLWTPFAMNEARFSPQSPTWAILNVVGRLKTDVDIEQAQSDLQVITGQLDKYYPPQATKFRANVTVEVIPLQKFLVHNVQSLLLILQGATGLVLLIACVNVANLLFSRGVIRSREMAVRASLGASRARLIRQSLTEALLLALAGSGLGGLVGFWSTAVLKQLVPASLPVDIRLDLRMLAFSAVVSALAVVMFGFGPAVITSRADVCESLRKGFLRIGPDRGARRLRGFLTISEVAFSLVLLAGAGLLARSLLRLSEVPLGFDPHGVLISTVQRPLSISNPGEFAAFFQTALQRTQALPGVEDAALTSQYPLGPPHNGNLRLNVQGVGQVTPPLGFRVTDISPAYFRTMRVPVLKGRVFSEADGAVTQPVIIMNDALARMIFNDRDPIGQHVSFATAPTAWMAVVGVVSAVRGDSLEEEPGPEVFLPYLQQPSYSMTFVLRTQTDPDALAGAVRSVIQQMDKNQPVIDVVTMDDVIAANIAPTRFNATLLGIFALLALLLAAIGIYGVVAYSCSQRTHEFGIRAALGAQQRDVFRLILGQGAMLGLTGVALGLAGTLGLTRFLRSMLFEITPTDPATLIGVAVLLLTVTLVACYIPARRAVRHDPMVALRYE